MKDKKTERERDRESGGFSRAAGRGALRVFGASESGDDGYDIGCTIASMI